MIRVRRLQPGDAAAYREIRLEMLEASPRAFAKSYAEEAGWPLARYEETMRACAVFGGCDGDRLLGVASLAREAMVKLRHKGTLWGMYVCERARGRGVGGALVEAVLAEARAWGLEQVLLTVTAGNDPAARLYARHGFRPYGTEPRAFKHAGGYLDEVLMLRFLDGPASPP